MTTRKLSTDRSVWTARLIVVAALLLVMSAFSPTSGASAAPAPYLGLTAMGMPSSPQPYMPSDFALTKHQRQTCGTSIDNGFGPPADGGTCPMIASHGADCSAPPATHPIGMAYADEMFICHDHLMTAFDPNGAGILEFQPNQLVDFSGGPATVSISRSTFNTTANGSRDYTEVYFVPFADQLAYNTDDNIGEVQKEARTYIRVEMRTQGGNTFAATEQVNGVQADLPGDFTTLEDATGLVDSAVIRTPIAFTLSATHFTLSCNGHVFIDANLPMTFPVTQVVPQFEHVSYDPEKDGDVPNTWHWSDLSISSAVPYYLQMAMPEAVGDYGDLGLQNFISFPAAPAGSFLRFQGFNDQDPNGFAGNYDISFDGGATWTHWASKTPQDMSLGSFWQPIPTGAFSAILRGGSGWYARDFYVMSLNGAKPQPTPTPTSMPTVTPTALPPTPTPIPTATPSPTVSPTPVTITIQNVPCIVTLNGVQQSGTCSGTFTH